MNILDPASWLSLASHYPDLVAILIGTLVGYVFTVTVEAYFLPTPPSRRQKGLTFLICWLASGTASGILWAFLDPKDPPKMRIAISFTVSILSFAGYPIIARIASTLLKRFGVDMGSAWS